MGWQACAGEVRCPLILLVGVMTLMALGRVLAADETSQGPDLVQEATSLQAVCGQCHNLQVVMDTPRSYQAWQDTMQDMVDRGARGTDDQYDDILDYLHRTMTTINVNTADEDELAIVLGVSQNVAQAIVARRKRQSFSDLADLESVPGVKASALASKTRLIYFQ